MGAAASLAHRTHSPCQLGQSQASDRKGGFGLSCSSAPRDAASPVLSTRQVGFVWASPAASANDALDSPCYFDSAEERDHGWEAALKKAAQSCAPDSGELSLLPCVGCSGRASVEDVPYCNDGSSSNATPTGVSDRRTDADGRGLAAGQGPRVASSGLRQRVVPRRPSSNSARGLGSVSDAASSSGGVDTMGAASPPRAASSGTRVFDSWGRPEYGYAPSIASSDASRRRGDMSGTDISSVPCVQSSGSAAPSWDAGAVSGNQGGSQNAPMFNFLYLEGESSFPPPSLAAVVSETDDVSSATSSIGAGASDSWGAAVALRIGTQSRPSEVCLSDVMAASAQLSVGTAYHDRGCRVCVFHFRNLSGGEGTCNHGKLCEFCHHPDHEGETHRKARSGAKADWKKYQFRRGK
mmetsp:Transcript_118816/g.272611  ORF Transcript_118816/g.272611 Transcript_118816/m.272611 type:complete len:409 (+) Transcript_118816:116-1342(+)